MKAAQVSTLDRLPLALANGVDSLISSGLAPLFGEAVVTHSPRESNGSSTSGSLAPESVRTQVASRIKDFPIPQAATKRRSFRETDRWEGLVTHVSESGIVATLSRRYQDFPAEEASIPWDEINSEDRALAQEGSTFHWKVGYLQIDGQQFSVSHIEFRRAPNFSAREKAAAKVRAAEYSSLFDA